MSLNHPQTANNCKMFEIVDKWRIQHRSQVTTLWKSRWNDRSIYIDVLSLMFQILGSNLKMWWPISKFFQNFCFWICSDYFFTKPLIYEVTQQIGSWSSKLTMKSVRLDASDKISLGMVFPAMWKLVASDLASGVSESVCRSWHFHFGVVWSFDLNLQFRGMYCGGEVKNVGLTERVKCIPLRHIS